MSDFAGNEELLQDFLTEANELLADLDNRLVDLEKAPEDAALLNAVFRNFHTIKGGAGFLGATELVKLCHRTESLFDRLRNGHLALDPKLMDLILSATAAVRDMFGDLGGARQPQGAPRDLLLALENALDARPARAAEPAPSAAGAAATTATQAPEPNWPVLLASIAAGAVTTPPAEGRAAAAPAQTPATVYPSAGRRASDDPGVEAVRAGRRETDKLAIAKDSTIRIDTARLDQVLNLSGEIGLTKNRLTCLRTELLSGKSDAQTLRALDESIEQLDLLVGDLQNAVMKTRMQPIGRLFQKYPRLVRDLARTLGKEIDLELRGEDTELDRTMIEELSDPLVHLVRNAVDHGMETPQERRAAGKPEKGTVALSARQAGDHIVIEISDDGRGIRPEVLRRKAIEKGLLDAESVHGMDDRQALQLIFLPGFSTKDQVSSVSGRGVGMDVVKTNIHKLNGRIEITSHAGVGTTISISLPLTLAILPVLVVRLGEQAFALPLTMVREIVRLDPAQVQSVSGKATVVIRDQVLPVRALGSMLDMPCEGAPGYGVLLQAATSDVVLAVDGFVGRDDLVIKPLDGVKPKGIAGATLSGDGSIVLVLDMEALFRDAPAESRARLFARAA
ncbi:MAG: chemotaxis protein CheA [Burkholderiales bacterium]|nr:chemotaxis protein CheA [Burkholderiales bacterium]